MRLFEQQLELNTQSPAPAQFASISRIGGKADREFFVNGVVVVEREALGCAGSSFAHPSRIAFAHTLRKSKVPGSCQVAKAPLGAPELGLIRLEKVHAFRVKAIQESAKPPGGHAAV